MQIYIKLAIVSPFQCPLKPWIVCIRYLAIIKQAHMLI